MPSCRTPASAGQVRVFVTQWPQNSNQNTGTSSLGVMCITVELRDLSPQGSMETTSNQESKKVQKKSKRGGGHREMLIQSRVTAT